MDHYDLETAFYEHLVALASAISFTVKPGQVFNAEKDKPTGPWRKGDLILDDPETIGFGDGVYSRVRGIYQIALRVPLAETNALKTLKNGATAHITHFFPANGRGLTLTKNTTSAHILKLPGSRHLGRDGAYLREIVEVDFHVDVQKEI